MAEENPLYRVIFVQNEQTYEIYARYLTEESLMGFIEIEELVFNETRSEVLVDPSEEKLRATFKNVKRSYIPLHAILRIDEVRKEGVARIVSSDTATKKKDNVSHLPLSD